MYRHIDRATSDVQAHEPLSADVQAATLMWLRALGGLVVDEGLQIAGDDYDTIFLLQDALCRDVSGGTATFPCSYLAQRNRRWL